MITNYVLIDRQLALGDPCRSGDVCNDTLAQCRAATCQCQENYFVSNSNTCSKNLRERAIKLIIIFSIRVIIQLQRPLGNSDSHGMSYLELLSLTNGLSVIVSEIL